MRNRSELLTFLFSSLFLSGCWDFDGLVCTQRKRSLDCERTCQPDYVARIAECAAAGGEVYYLLDRPANNSAIVAEDSTACGGSVKYSTFKVAAPPSDGSRCADGMPYAFDPTKRYFVRGAEVFLDVASGL